MRAEEPLDFSFAFPQIQAEIDSLRAEHLQQKEALSVSHKTNEEQWRRVESQIEDCEHKCITFTKIREDFEKGETSPSKSICSHKLTETESSDVPLI